MAPLSYRARSAAGASAALAASLVLAACGGRAVRVPDRKPAFPFRGALHSAAVGAPILFELPAEPRLRSISPAESGFLLWDHERQVLESLGDDGASRDSWPLEAAFAWIQGDLCLARSAAFEEGTGVSFALCRIDGKRGPRRLWEGRLDCFPSDVVLTDGKGRATAYVAGGDAKDAESAVYALRRGRAPERLFALPKRGSFLRLVLARDGRGFETLFAFQSAAEKKPAPLVVRALATGDRGRGFRELPVDGLPPGFVCAYGYGFDFGGDLAVPAAMEDGSVSLLRLSIGPDRCVAVSTAADAKGCYAPLGPDPDGLGFWYLGRDALADPGAWWLVRYDGERAEAERLDERDGKALASSTSR